MITRLLNWLYSNDKKQVQSFCELKFPHEQASDKRSINWKLQDTKYGCNGDVDFNGHDFTIETHTNKSWTAPSSSSWKENRCEVTTNLDGDHKWSFKFNPEKLSSTSDWVIISQLWARDYDNFLSVVVQNSTKQTGKFKLRLDSKQNKKTKTLWSGYFDKGAVSLVDLKIEQGKVLGSINGFDVGNHSFKAPNKHELKVGAYWSGRIPFNDSGKMIIHFSDVIT